MLIHKILIHKILRRIKRYCVFVSDLLFPGSADIPVQEAESWLNAVSKDPDSSCYTDSLFLYSAGEYELSIIIPAYNSEKWIKTALDSVLEQQTKYSYEVIVVNDGSTDGTGEILRTYQACEKLKVISQENRGFSGARNTGLARARGKYLMFVDSDDHLLPGSIEALMNCACETDSDVVAANYRIVYSNGITKDVMVYKYGELTDMSILHGQPWAKVYKRELFEHLKYPEGYWFEDTIFSQVVWPMCGRCYTIAQPVYGYFQNIEGITSKAPGSPKAVDSFYIMRKLLEDKSRFNVEIGEKAFMSFLDMVRLTYSRTRFQDKKTKCCIFVLQCQLYKEYFGDIGKTALSTKLEAALAEKNYRQYLLACENKG